LDEYLYEPLLGGTLITVEISPSHSSTYADFISNLPNIGCRRNCRSLWDGHGRWKAGRWSPYVPGKLTLILIFNGIH
jgi:hypothetical protein